MSDAQTDAVWMDRALLLAASARPSPNPRVGCVLVRDGERVGEGYHHFAGGPHAELVALQGAGEKARGATAYITLEPCNHHGRTAPCTEALLRAGVTRVVAGTLDPNPHVDGGGLEYLAERGLTVELGVQQRACEALLRSWRHHLTTGQPWVTLKVAMSLDGRIATRNRQSQWLTGEEARRDAHVLRAASDAVLVGVGTVLADDPMLTPRNVTLPGPLPARVVLDSALRTPLSSALCRTANEAPVWLFHAADAPAERVKALGALGVETLCVPRLGEELE